MRNYLFSIFSAEKCDIDLNEIAYEMYMQK